MTAYWQPLAFFYMMFAVGCATLESYRLPANMTEYATIEDHPFRFGMNEYDHVVSIDRRRVDRESREIPEKLPAVTNLRSKTDGNVIVLNAGVRKLEVRVCESTWDLQHAFSLHGPWHCGRSVLRLEALPGRHYRLFGVVNHDEDSAELWIEAAQSHEKVAGPIRIIGLEY